MKVSLPMAQLISQIISSLNTVGVPLAVKTTDFESPYFHVDHIISKPTKNFQVGEPIMIVCSVL